MKENRGVGILIIRDGKILLGHRCEGWANDTWTMPGGKLDKNESPEEGAKREVKEEIGLEINDLELTSVNEDMIKDKMFKTFIFKPNVIEGKMQAKELKEIDKWKWFELNKLPRPMYPPSQKAIRQYLKVNK